MPSVPGIRALLSLHKAPLHVRQFSLYAKLQEENKSLVARLTLMGVDVNMVRQRRPGMLCSTTTNELGLLGFLQSKGASRTLVAGIISRTPRDIYHSTEALEKRWGMWHSILESDSEILSMLERSPRCFFRAQHSRLEKNSLFLSSRGLNTKLLATLAPSTFCKSVESNRETVKFLEDVCAELGAEDPESFVNAVITKHSLAYGHSRSSKQMVKTNLDFLRVSLKLNDLELLDFLLGSGFEPLTCKFMNDNFKVLEQRLLSEGCRREDIRTMLMNCPEMLKWVRTDTFNAKVDCLLEGGITVEQFMKDPIVLDPDL